MGSLVIFLAIIAHKGAAAFALIVDFQRNGLPQARITRVLILFASMTPLGIVLGTVLDRLLAASYGRLFEGIFDSLAAGTFIYVAVLEIIGKEFDDQKRIVPKFVALCAGLALMALIAVWV